jgi:uncharacterized protein YjiS (DUF1127 family)
MEDLEMQIRERNGATPGWLVAWVLGSARRRHELRKAAAGLMAMDDHLLRDIGVTRADAVRIARG